MLRQTILAAFILLVSCGSGSGAPSDSPYLTVEEAPLYLPIERLGPPPIEQTVERRRWLFEEEVERRHLPLLRRIKREQIGNFGGVEWRWSDGPQNDGLGDLTGLVYFVDAPEATLARFTRDPLFQAARADFPRSDQDQVARRWAETIGRDVASESFSNMQVPTLDVALPRDEYEQRVRAEGWRLPANLRIRLNPRAEPDLPAVTPDLENGIRAFPREARLSGPVPDMASFDTIVLRRGCFFIDLPGHRDPLVEFPLGIGVHRDREGHVAFRPLYRNDKRRLGRVGTRLQLGWRSERPAPPALESACGADRIVTISSVDQAAGYGWSAEAIRAYGDRAGVGTKEALARANACLIADEHILADNRRRGRTVAPGACAALGLSGHSAPPPPPDSAEAASPPLLKRLEPNRNGVCRFEQRDPRERPKGLVQTNYRSNMIFWADPGAILWDHPNGETDEAILIPGKRIVAARAGRQDLWISPARNGDTLLYSGPDRFECVLRGG